MITLFTIPKPFAGHIGIIQDNAIRSWTRLPGSEVILFGDEDGLAAAATRLGVRHVPGIGRNEQGTPLVSDAFDQVRRLATTPLLAYANTDIIFEALLLGAAAAVRDAGLDQWLLVGQRHDLDVTERLDFADGWEAALHADVAERGRLHGKAGMDFFLFPRDMPVRLPYFAVGRPGWDSWLIYQTRAAGIPVVDATAVVMAVHQNHPPAYRAHDAEARQNTRAAGGHYHMGTLRDADWRLVRGRAQQLELTPNLLGKLLFTAPVRRILAAKRYMQAIYGR